MSLDNEYFADLALAYIQGSVSIEEKRMVHQLIMESTEFLQILKNELELHRQVESLRQPIPDSLKYQVFTGITTGQHIEEQIYARISAMIFEQTLPAAMWFVIKLFQRGVLVYE